MSDEELLAAREAQTGYGGQNSEDGYEIYDELRLAAAARIRELIAERDDWKQAANDMLDRALEAEAEIKRLRALLREARGWLADDRLNTWPYIEGGDFHRDVDAWLKRIDAALAEDKP